MNSNWIQLFFNWIEVINWIQLIEFNWLNSINYNWIQFIYNELDSIKINGIPSSPIWFNWFWIQLINSTELMNWIQLIDFNSEKNWIRFIYNEYYSIRMNSIQVPWIQFNWYPIEFNRRQLRRIWILFIQLYSTQFQWIPLNSIEFNKILLNSIEFVLLWALLAVFLVIFDENPLFVPLAVRRNGLLGVHLGVLLIVHLAVLIPVLFAVLLPGLLVAAF